jgi:hypothetical protein
MSLIGNFFARFRRSSCSGFGRLRPVARRIAISAVMTMPPDSAALNSNAVASSHCGFRCAAFGSAVFLLRCFVPGVLILS